MFLFSIISQRGFGLRALNTSHCCSVCEIEHHVRCERCKQSMPLDDSEIWKKRKPNSSRRKQHQFFYQSLPLVLQPHHLPSHVTLAPALISCKIIVQPCANPLAQEYIRNTQWEGSKLYLKSSDGESAGHPLQLVWEGVLKLLCCVFDEFGGGKTKKATGESTLKNTSE